MEHETQAHDGPQTAVIGEHRSRSHSYSGIGDQVHNAKALVEAAGIPYNGRWEQDTSRKAEKQTCEVVRANPCMAVTRSWSRFKSIARTPAI